MRKTYKILLGTLTVVVAVVFFASLYLYFFFPYDKIRSYAINEAKKTLGVNLDLGPMRISFFTGLSIESITITDSPYPPYPGPVLQLDRLVIDYDLWALLGKKLRITRVLLDSPKLDLRYRDGILNLTRILDRLEKEGPPIKATEKPEVAGLPVEIYLEDFLLRNPTVMVDDPQKMQVMLSGIDIQGKLSLEKESSHLSLTLSTSDAGSSLELTLPEVSFKTRPAVDLQVRIDDFQQIAAEGSLRLDQMQIRLEKEIPPLSLTAKIKASVDLQQETARLSSLDIALNQSQRMNLSADIERLFDAPKVRAVVKGLELDLGPLMEMARSFIPDMSLQGKILIDQLHLEGGLDEDKKPLALRLSDGRGRLAGINCRTKGIEIEGVGGRFNLREAVLEGQLPKSIQLDMNLNTRYVRGAGFQVEGAKGVLKVESVNILESALLELETHISTARISDATLSDFDLTIKGDIKHPDLTQSGFHIKIGLGEVERVGGYPVHAAGFGADIRLYDMLLEGKKIKQVKAAIDFANRSLILPDIELKGIEGNISASATGDNLEKNSLQANIEKMQVNLDLPQTGHQELSMRVSGTAAGNFQEVEITAGSLKFGIGDFWQGSYKVRTSGLNKFSISGSSVLDLAKIIIPPALKEKVGEIRSGGELEISGLVKSIAADTDDLPPGADPVALTFDKKIRFKNTGLQIERPSATVKNLHSELSVKGRYSSSGGVKDLNLAGTVAFGALNVPDLVSTDKTEVTINFNSSDQEFSDSALLLDLLSSGVRLLKENYKMKPLDLSLKVNSKQQIPQKRVQIKEITLSVPEKIQLQGGGELQEWGESFDINIKGIFSDLDWALLQAPESVRREIPLSRLAGKIDFQLRAKGKKPTDEDIKDFDIPVDLTANIAGEAIGFTYPAKDLTVDNLRLNTDLSYQKGAASISGQLHVGSFTPHTALAPAGVSYKINMDQGLDRLLIGEGTRLDMADKKISLGVSGEIGGVKVFIAAKTPVSPESVLKEVSAHLAVKLSGYSPKEIDLPGNYRIKGLVENDLKIDLNPGDSLLVEGKLRLDDFQAAEKDTLLLEDMTLKLPYRKKLYFSPPPEREQVEVSQVPLAVQGLFGSLGRFSQTRNNLHVRRLRVGKLEMQNIFGDLAFKGDSIGAERFGMDLFGGGVGGDFLIFSDSENHIIRFSAEFAGISFDYLMPPKYRTGNLKYTIGGNLNLAIYLDRKGDKEKIDLKRIDLHLRVTHIGYDSLNQLLFFLDPKESNPSIINARDTLKLATPVMVDLKIAYGNLSLALELESKVLAGAKFSLPVLNRIPLDILKNFDKISKTLDKLAPVKKMMEILSAKGVGFDEDKKIIFIQ